MWELRKRFPSLASVRRHRRSRQHEPPGLPAVRREEVETVWSCCVVIPVPSGRSYAWLVIARSGGSSACGIEFYAEFSVSVPSVS